MENYFPGSVDPPKKKVVEEWVGCLRKFHQTVKLSFERSGGKSTPNMLKMSASPSTRLCQHVTGKKNFNYFCSQSECVLSIRLFLACDDFFFGGGGGGLCTFFSGESVSLPT